MGRYRYALFLIFLLLSSFAFMEQHKNQAVAESIGVQDTAAPENPIFGDSSSSGRESYVDRLDVFMEFPKATDTNPNYIVTGSLQKSFSVSEWDISSLLVKEDSQWDGIDFFDEPPYTIVVHGLSVDVVFDNTAPVGSYAKVEYILTVPFNSLVNLSFGAVLFVDWGLGSFAKGVGNNSAVSYYMLSDNSVILHIYSYIKLENYDGTWYTYNFTILAYTLNVSSGQRIILRRWSSWSKSGERVASMVFSLDFAYSHGVVKKNVDVDHRNNGTVVFHSINLYVPVIGTRVSIDYPDNWFFYSISPEVWFDQGKKMFVATMIDTYFIVWYSFETWVYSSNETSRVSFYNSRGQFIPFDSLHTSIAKSPERLLRYTPSVEDDSLVAWWRFNKAGNFTYDWKNNISGAVMGGASFTVGYISNAISFDGTDDYIDVGANPVFYFPNDFSVEFWFRASNKGVTAQVDMITRSYSTTWSAANYRIGIADSGASNDPLRVIWGDGVNSDTLSTNRGVEDNQWHHIVVVFQDDTVRIYLDGVLNSQKTTSVAHTFNANAKLYIGFSPGGSSSNFFSGSIDELRFYRRALSAEEVFWHFAITMYFDGYQDILGREPSYTNVSEIGRGLFGYASYNRYSSGKGMYEYVKDVSATIDENTKGYSIITVFKPDAGVDSIWQLIIGKIGWHWSIYYDGANQKVKVEVLSRDENGFKHHYFAPNIIVEPNRWHIVVASVTETSDYIKTYILVDGQEWSATTGGPNDIAATLTANWGIGGFISINYARDPFAGWVDEAIWLRTPLSPEMAKNIYCMARKYVGGFYVDDDFEATWANDIDSSEDGYGFSENFADISDWSLGGVADSTSFSTNGDIATFVSEFSAGTGTVYSYIRTNGLFSTNLDDETYRFLEARIKVNWNVSLSSPNMHIRLDVTNGTDYAWATVYTIVGTTDWQIIRVNIHEAIISSVTAIKGEYIGDWDVRYIVIEPITTNPSVPFKVTVQIDWIRIYNLKPYSYAATTDINENDWATSLGGIMRLHAEFETSNDEFLEMKRDIPDIATVGAYFEIRAKGKGLFALWFTGAYKSFWWDSADWATVRVNLQTLSYQIIEGSDPILVITGSPSDTSTLYGFSLEVNDRAEFPAVIDFYIDYVRIGPIGEKIQSTTWQPLLYSLYQHPIGQYMWFNITNIFGDTLFYGARPYAVYQDFILQVYSFKIKNQKSDFVHVNISRNAFAWSEWLGPGEIANYILSPGAYTLTITYPDSSYTSFNLDITGDSYYLIQGTTLEDVLVNIENVNSSLSQQIINVNLTVTNWNSQINNTIVNVQINLNNVNSSIYNEIITTQTMINSFWSNMNTTLLNIDVDVGYVYSNLTAFWADAENNWYFLYANISNLNNNITVQIQALNSSITKNITIQLNELNNLIDKLFNKLQLGLYNEYTGLGLNPNMFVIYYDGFRSQSLVYYTLKNETTVTITDYFGHVLFNATVPVPNEIAVAIPILDIGFLNNNSFPVRVNITQFNHTISYILQPNQLFTVQLLAGNYSITVERVWLDENGTITKSKLLYSRELKVDEHTKLLYLTLEGAKLFPQEFQPPEEWHITIFGTKIYRSQFVTAIFFGALSTIVGLLIRESYRKSKEKIEDKEVIWL